MGDAASIPETLYNRGQWRSLALSGLDYREFVGKEASLPPTMLRFTVERLREGALRLVGCPLG